MATHEVDALVIFGATGDLAKIETFPALVGLVQRGVLDVPVIGVAKSGWGLEQFRDYAVASLKLNGMDPAEPAAVKMLGLLRYVDGDLGDEATYKAMSDITGSITSKAESAPGPGADPRGAVEAYGERYRANPKDADVALAYGQALRATGQRAQAVARPPPVRTPQPRVQRAELGLAEGEITHSGSVAGQRQAVII